MASKVGDMVQDAVTWEALQVAGCPGGSLWFRSTLMDVLCLHVLFLQILYDSVSKFESFTEINIGTLEIFVVNRLFLCSWHTMGCT